MGLCQDCQEGLAKPGSLVCRWCGRPLISEIDCCLSCRQAQPAFDQCRAGFLYRGAARDIILSYKYKRDYLVKTLFLRALVPIIKELPQGAAILPAPSSKKSLARRGWNPVAEFARVLAKESGRLFLDPLEKCGGAEQKRLSLEDRRLNMRGRVRLKPRWASGIRGDYIVFDDVCTTGATMGECAHTLKQAGAVAVYGVCLGLD